MKTITKKIIIVLLFFSFIYQTIIGQESQVVENITFYSNILKEQMTYSAYFPKGYSTSQRKYPVLYLLHGAGSNQNSWIQEGEMQQILDSAIKEGNATPMVVIMPDAGLSYFMNNKDGTYPFADFFIKELIPHIDQTYSLRQGKKYRAIAGLSMGGFGALLYGLQYPELFGASAAISAAVRTDEEINAMSEVDYLRRYGKVIGETKDEDSRISEFWNRNSPLYLVENMTVGEKGMVQFYFEIGDDDNRNKGNSALHNLMKDYGIPHEYRVKDGAHDWNYWRGNLPDILNFVSESFRKKD